MSSPYAARLLECRRLLNTGQPLSMIAYDADFVTTPILRESFRRQGIIAMADDDRRFVVQGVHMLIEGGSRRAWKKNEAPQSRLVFIGRDLPGDLLKQGFEACRA